MSSNSQYLDVKLLDKEYRVVCAPDEREALLAAVAYVDGKMRDISGKTRNAGNAERIAVMAAMDIAHEYLLYKASPPASKKGTETAVDIGVIQRRISSMEEKLDAALSPDRLF